ncbi:rcc01693 family protein [uncultured Roseicyclus sp.]|mgnify:CR=1 FL=1|jgi:uncharacterized phage protein (TIGR02216 family)|uniref:rcc01693 family protein n=1 Tax=uncultured Roseicyclus sp. TaxID=543072 RepID=UPI00261A140D|nr:rcc01693 family protein [uncultured Roseicyclus sp.]
MSDTGFDWPAVLRAGLQGLGLAPENFWRLTPVELLLMLGDAPEAAPLGRARLEALIAQFPDVTNKESGDGRNG